MKKLLGLLLACLVSFSAAAQTAPVPLSQATKDLEDGLYALDVTKVEKALKNGADYRLTKWLVATLARASSQRYKHKDQVMQIVRLLVKNGADMTVRGYSGQSALEKALWNLAGSSWYYRDNGETYKRVFDVLDLMLSLTDSSKALSTVNPKAIEDLIEEAGFDHPELFRYLLDKGLKVQSRYVKKARKKAEYDGDYKEVADILQQAYEEQTPEFIKEVVKRDLQIGNECPALKRQF